MLEDRFAEMPSIASVPVCAYLISQRKQPVWIIVYRWEVVSPAEDKVKLGHVRVYAFDLKRARKIGFVTCG